MAKKAEPSRVAAALQYLQQMRDRAADFGGGVVDTLADRARDVGGLAYEAFTSDPNIGRMTTAEYAQAAAARAPTPRLDATAQGVGALGNALVTQPVQTARAVVVDPVVEAFESPRSMGQFAGEFVNPLRIAAALRKTAPIAELDVYHGTPHQFEPTEENPLGEFDASKIGTGERAQAYGHGIYFSEKPDVARSYQFKSLTGDIKFNDGTQINVLKLPKNSPEKLAAQLWLTNPNLEEATKFVESVDQKKWAGTNPEWSVSKERVLEELKKLNQKGAKLGGGAFYQADLPDEMIDRMLDYDKPLSEQPEIFAALQKAGFKVTSDMTGGDLVNTRNRNGSAPYLSDDLRQAGIPGIKYLDEGSRGGSGTGTRNFVVFPGEEKKVKILKRD
jgi:hypothetical protein